MTESGCRVLVMAGGTGGHVIPGLAVADCLRQGGASICWLGTRRGIEAELVPGRGYELKFLDVEGIRGRGLGALLRAPLVLWRSITQALRAIAEFKPQVVLGMGGYAAGPGGVAARLRGIPLVIHEQNSVAGTTNRILARLASRVLQGFPGVFKKGEWCGNPVRPEIAALPAPGERFAQRSGTPRLLVLGGSRGARAINELLPEALALVEDAIRPVVLHQCGRDHLQATQALYASRDIMVEVVPFIQNMRDAYLWADFAVCRAGALTIAELTAAGLGALLIPFPYAIDDHQTINASLLVESDAAVLLPESTLDAQRLADQISALCRDKNRRLHMAENARRLARVQATQRVAEVCMEVARDR